MKHFKFFMEATFTARAAILISCLYEPTEERMRLQRLRFKFGMELATQKVRMIRKFHDLHIRSVGSSAGDLQSCASQDGLILAIELIAMTMPFPDLGSAVSFGRETVSRQLARPRRQAHGDGKFVDAA